MKNAATTLAGRFIVLDGPDGTGKSTQVARLAEHVCKAGVPVCTVRDPGGTAIGDKVRAILLDKAHDEMCAPCETMLYMASRAQLVAQVIRPALVRGECVISDRYISSTIAYQGAGGVDIESIRRVADVAVGSLWPDLTIVLDIDAEVGLTRLKGAPDRMESKALAFHRRVRELFVQQARQSPAAVTLVDANGDIDQVHRRVVTAVEGWKFAVE